MINTSAQSTALTSTGKGVFSLKFKLLVVVTLIVTLITAVNLALSSYITYQHNQEEAHQKLVLQLKLFSQEVERKSADVMRVAHDTVNTPKNLTDLITLFTQNRELKKFLNNIMFFRIAAWTQFHSTIAATGIYGIAVYVDNGLSHYITRDEVGAEIIKNDERVIINESVAEDGNVNLKGWRSWASNPLPEFLPRTIEMPEQQRLSLLVSQDAIMLRLVVPVQGNLIGNWEAVGSTNTDEARISDVQPASPEALEQARQNRQDARIIGGMVFLQRLDRAFLEERDATAGILHVLASEQGDMQLGSIEFQQLADTLSDGTPNAGQEVFTTLMSAAGEAHYAMLMRQPVVEDTGLILGVALSKQPTLLKIRETIQWIAGVSLGCLLVVLLVGGVMIERLIRPIRALSWAAQRLSEGDVEAQIHIESRDELGELARNFQILIDVTKETTRVAEEIANGNVNVEVRKRSNNDRLMQALDQMIHSLKDVATVAQSIAIGDVSVKMPARSDQDMLAQALNQLIEATNATTRVAEEIADGNLDITVAERSEDDRMMRALNRMIGSLQEVAGVAEAMAEGNLTVEVRERSSSNTLMRALNAMLDKLNGVFLEVKGMAAHVATGGRQMSATAEALSQATTEQAAAAEEASSSMEQMAANIRQNSDNARQTEKIALQSAEDALQGGQAVAKTITAMKEIEERISIIQEIAMQTNILSMNATIEAAKAQDYGKGFGVVASEVRSLAHHTREAADQIEQLVRSCVNISEQAGEILQRLVPNSQKTAELVQEIAAASGEQSLGAEQINMAIQQLDSVIQQNAATADEMAGSAELLAQQADQLHTAMEFFTVRESGNVASEPPEDINTLRELLQEAWTQNQMLLSQLQALAPDRTGHPQPETPGLQEDVASKASKAQKTAEHHLDLGEPGALEDAQDGEFEPY